MRGLPFGGNDKKATTEQAYEFAPSHRLLRGLGSASYRLTSARECIKLLLSNQQCLLWAKSRHKWDKATSWTNTVALCVVAVLSPLPPTTGDRRQSVGMPAQVPHHSRQRVRPRPIRSVRSDQRRSCSRRPPSPSRRVCRARRVPRAHQTTVPPNSWRSRRDAKTTLRGNDR